MNMIGGRMMQKGLVKQHFLKYSKYTRKGKGSDETYGRKYHDPPKPL